MIKDSFVRGYYLVDDLDESMYRFLDKYHSDNNSEFNNETFQRYLDL